MNIFLTGASGYIGGSIATRLVERGHVVRGLVRTVEKATAVEKFGVTPVVGDLSQSALLSAEAHSADAVINAADSDHRAALEAMLDGLDGSGKALIHTSGSSVVSDVANGEPSDLIFDEDTPVAPTEMKKARLAIDNLVRAASTRQIRSVVICNTLIYGHGLGAHRDSIQVPSLIAQAKKNGTARHVGRGHNRWSCIHIEDVVSLYISALERAPAGLFLFAEGGEVQFAELTAAIAQRLKLPPAEGWEIDKAVAEWGYEYAVYALGSNSRVRSKYSRRVLDWKPVQKGVLNWVAAEAT